MRKTMAAVLTITTVLAAGSAVAATKTVTVNAINANGIGPAIGTIALRDTKKGLFIDPKLASLPPGQHGFHVHAKGDCGPGPGPNNAPAAGMAAGGHYDPKNTGKHMGPHSAEGHQGDVPVLVVDGDGTTHVPMLAEHLKVKDVVGHAIMIHAGGDNYSDQPQPLGGGGGRIACGVVK